MEQNAERSEGYGSFFFFARHCMLRQVVPNKTLRQLPALILNFYLSEAWKGQDCSSVASSWLVLVVEF